jgi:transcription-repair coupling factor (superfamily II helicase)
MMDLMIDELKQRIANISKSKPDIITISGLSRIDKAYFIAKLTLSDTVVLVDNENEAMRLCDDVNTLSAGTAAAVYPARDVDFAGAEATSSEYEHRRIAVLSNLPNVIIATPEAACQTTFSRETLTKRIICIEKDSEVNTESLYAQLIDNGYTRVDMVEGISQFSVRGSVIDIYPIGCDNPVRLDLWGDTVDSIGNFDVETQRRTSKLERLFISPSKEEQSNSCLLDYVHNVVICEQMECNVHINAAYEQIMLEGNHHAVESMIEKWRYEEILSQKCRLELCGFGNADSIEVKCVNILPWNGDYSRLKADLRQFLNEDYSLTIFGGTDKSARGLALDLRDDGFKADFSEKSREVHGHIFVTGGTLSSGYDYPLYKVAAITLAGVGRGGNSAGGSGGTKSKKARRKNKAEAIRALTEINVGDYIVHDSYGIGVFEGVTKLTNDGISKDYIKLRYAGKDALYVPVTQLDFIARYIGNTETASLKLSKLHTDTWFKTKARTKKAVEELAQELIEMYALRMKSKGIAFSADTPEQVEFESRFSYIETDDQLTCIDELKKDMLAPQPMDRLLCGDVGFGKTEVALRGAFKCIMDGYQCALLCPTTVLAWQHYQTAVSRMNSGESGLPEVNIELLSRFRTTKEKNEVLRKLKSGVCDFVIGTHALVGKTVEFKNLGLVIIDEEQRFGVMQKERLKEAFSGTDVLTLSATPIPRTLNMAMSGIRDMSVIESPPHDRLPVKTYVTEHDSGVVAAAIQKELRRAGQVYYVHNRVETIVSCAAKLHELLPDARIGIAHGRMDERGLLEVWRKLLEREIDVLVCTTLIETGVDVPNVNTLIIENADHMGLAQLHQLRGRVGRTNRRAYAYFCFARGKVLSEIAEKRLKAVREFTQFGAGFKIALRDLEIRGAGSVLGESQSGHLSAVGYETYVRLLEEAVREAGGESAGHDGESDGAGVGRGTPGASCPAVQCVVDIKADAFIPESYIGNQSQRIACYKKIAEIRDEADAADIVDELTDRYGTLPKSVRGLVEAARLRNMAGSLGIAEIVHEVRGKDSKLILYWSEPDMQRLSRVPERFAKRVELNLVGRVNVSVKLGKFMVNERGKWHEFEAIEDVLGAGLEFLESLGG